MTFFVDAITKLPNKRLKARRIGEYLTREEAVAAAKQMIDDFLYREYRQSAGHGVTAERLLARYEGIAEVPYIWRKRQVSTNMPGFDHKEYAARRCADICADEPKK